MQMGFASLFFLRVAFDIHFGFYCCPGVAVVAAVVDLFSDEDPGGGR